MKNFGDFLKGFAYLFLIGGICLVIEIVIKLSVGDGIEAAIVIGGIALFPTFAIIYGFGEIISKLCMIEGNTKIIANNINNLAEDLSTIPVTPVNNIAEFFPTLNQKQEESKLEKSTK